MPPKTPKKAEAKAGGKKDKSYFELMTMEISPSTATGGAKNYF